MLERVADRVKHRLKDWTLKMAGEGAETRIQAIARPENEYGVDPFGFNLDYALSAIAPLVWMYRHYFRVRTYGIEQVPPGRVLLIANHSGQLPWDGAMIGVAMLLEADPPRAIRSMIEKWAATLPYVSTFFSRVGQIVGTPENCRRLLEKDEAILVFPEGVRGITKLWPQRYQLQEFGLGFMRLALETKTPIVPVAVIGAEEQAPALLDIKPLARLLGMPAFPITPTGLPLPLPSRYHIHFGEPMRFSGRADDDDAELDKKVKQVKTTLQAMINEGLRERESVFF
ncbi:MAG: acyltransferase family protein [Myxococcaceae bacterium]|nr:acyltransferase family protein [Myxococcaceae bacterium]